MRHTITVERNEDWEAWQPLPYPTLIPKVSPDGRWVWGMDVYVRRRCIAERYHHDGRETKLYDYQWAGRREVMKHRLKEGA